MFFKFWHHLQVLDLLT